MKRFFNLFAFVALLIFAVSCNGYKYESVKGDPTGARIYTLDNGLKVYMIVNKDEPRLEAQVAVRVGSKNDPRETTGLAHYFEHLMFKGTKQFGTQDYSAEEPLLNEIEALFETYRQTTDEAERKAIYHKIDSVSYEASKIFIPNEYDKLMAAIGGRGTNAYTSYDVTCYTENIPSNQIENWAKIQADRFENCVIRGFHTELETVYEEYNMYSAMDAEKVNNALFGELFKKHPYGVDVIGLPEHLKNPSITNIKKYHDNWYVPNNMAVCLVGDFDPDKTIKVIDKYFGTLKPNENLKKPEFEAEEPINGPVVKEAYGIESPSVTLGWRVAGANSDDAAMLSLIGRILYNGTAGLIDLDVNQQQKTLGMYAFYQGLADYGVFLMQGEPKMGQSLEEVSAIALSEVEKVKKGEFSDELLEAIVNNMKLAQMRQFDNSRSLVRMEVNSFINGTDWADEIGLIEKISSITKDEIVAFANENLGNNYVEVRKLEQKSPEETPKITKPQITPIVMNRDVASNFLQEIQASEVEPIEPVFIDFGKDMSILEAKSGIQVLYKKNETNGTFSLNYIFDSGRFADKELDYAASYADYLGTSTMTPTEVKEAFYKLACSYSIRCFDKETYITLNGLAENMDKAIELLENVLSDVQPQPEALAALKSNILFERRNAKLDQAQNQNRLLAYCLYGPVNPMTDDLSAAAINSLTDDQLVEKIHNLLSYKHRIMYYGPLGEKEFVDVINREHKVPEELLPLAENKVYPYLPTESTRFIIAPYDANQLLYYSVSNTGKTFDPEIVPIVTLYNSYFGSGMNSIVFQEMREARGLAYTAYARYNYPSNLDDPCIFMDYIGTQNDKLMDAQDAFNEIINNMPVSETAFTLAKESVLANIRTKRTVKAAVLNVYLAAEKLGLGYDINKDVYEKVQGYTLDDVVKFQRENIKDLPYTIGILGRQADMDLNSLGKYGPITKVTTEEIFGY